MNILEILEHFGAMLRARLDAGVFTTEDSIRYTFYAAAALYGGVRHTEVVLEHPHPAIPNARVDTIISAFPPRRSMALEFKYDRGNPGGSNQNRTQRAASVLIDIFRLARIPTDLAVDRYFVYITHREMAGYFQNPKNQLERLFDLSGKHSLRLGQSTFVGLSRTLRTRIDPHVCECHVRALYATDLTDDVTMRTFKVTAA